MEEAEQMRGGLYIPDTAKEKPQQGEIVAVGPGRFDEGKRVPMEVKVGDKVLYGKYSGTEVTVDGEQLQLLRSGSKLQLQGKKRLGSRIHQTPEFGLTVLNIDDR